MRTKLYKQKRSFKNQTEKTQEYSNKLVMNTDKTKLMIFNKTGKLMRSAFSINGIQLENVRSYKYLGFLLTPSGKISSGLNDLRDMALKAFMKLKNNSGTAFYEDILTTFTLVDAMIKPMLLYNSDFWGCMKLPKNKPIENLHMLICKQLLGGHRTTTNIGVLLELGRIPLGIFAAKLAVKNWERFRKGEANCLILASHRDAMEENHLWITSIRNDLEKNDMLNFFINSYDDKPPFINKRIFQTLTDGFHQVAFASINEESSKLRTYATFKKSIGYETYLSDIKNATVRRRISKFRLSNHALIIETSRHNRVPKELRVCPLCPNSMETEVHFLLLRPTYNIRKDILCKLYRKITLNSFGTLLVINLIILYLILIKNIGKYINDIFQWRV